MERVRAMFKSREITTQQQHQTFLQFVKELEQKQRLYLLGVVLIFVITIMIQSKTHGVVGLNGVLAQVQVILSILLAVKFDPYGYKLALALNVVVAVMVTAIVFFSKSTASIPGVIIPVGTIVTVLVIVYFMNNIKEHEKKLEYLAYFDLLTELPNRKMIINRLELMATVSHQRATRFALVFIDINNFKRINDAYGHHTGDLLLENFVDRLKSWLHPDDFLGRFTGDGFALIIQRPLKDEEIFEYIEMIRRESNESFIIGVTTIHLSANFGIAIFPTNGTTANEMVRFANAALNQSKLLGSNNICFFNEEIKDQVIKKLAFETCLTSAIEKDEIYLVFQPQFTVANKEEIGFEALVRWHSPEFGDVDALHLISVTEKIGYMVSLGEWILKTACTLFKDLVLPDAPSAMLSVNLSTVQLKEPSFLTMVSAVLKETGFSPSNLVLEVTESILIDSMDEAIGVLNTLRAMGIRIALDDFGTGYSSFNYLQLLPIDTLKIDKSFIGKIGHDTRVNAIVGSLISLVHQLGINVVAEGVETQEQLEVLKAHGCDRIQGYLWGRPTRLDTKK